MTESTIVSRIGIVDAVAAKRQNDEVKYLSATVRIETELDDEYSYSEAKAVDTIAISVPTNAGVNPGDVVELYIKFVSPFGQRFQPALTVSEDDINEAVVNASQDA